MPTVEDRLLKAAAALQPPHRAVPPFAGVRRRTRRRRALVLAAVVVVAGGVAAAIVAGTGRGRVVVTTPVPSTVPGPRPTTPTIPTTTATPTTTTTATTTSPTAPAGDPLGLISGRLDAFVRAEQTAYSHSGAVTSEHSAPVRVGDGYLAVAAFSFHPDPVQVLSYTRGGWSRIAALPAPTSPGTIYRADTLDLFSDGATVSVAPDIGDHRPGFLVPFAGGGCFSAAVVSQDANGVGWRYVPFRGPFPPGEVLGGNPKFVGGTLVSTNDCTAVPLPPAQRHTWTWTYDPVSAAFVGLLGG